MLAQKYPCQIVQRGRACVGGDDLDGFFAPVGDERLGEGGDFHYRHSANILRAAANASVRKLIVSSGVKPKSIRRS